MNLKPFFLLFLTSIFLNTLRTHAQDDFLDELMGETTEYAIGTFMASRIINGHSVEQPAVKELEFRISHRFGKLNSGGYELWGLDQAYIHFSLEYGIFDWFTVGAGRSNFEKTYDGFVKFNIVQQKKGAENFPLSISWFSSTEYVSLKTEVPDFETKHRFSFTHQLLIARKFGDRLSLQLTPGIVHKNLVETADQKNTIPSLGIAGRMKITKRLSLNIETFLVDHGPMPEDVTYYNPLSVGVDLETGGHVFQIMVTNSQAMREAAFITNTTGNWLDGDIHLGFNISRMF